MAAIRFQLTKVTATGRLFVKRTLCGSYHKGYIWESCVRRGPNVASDARPAVDARKSR